MRAGRCWMRSKTATRLGTAPPRRPLGCTLNPAATSSRNATPARLVLGRPWKTDGSADRPGSPGYVNLRVTHRPVLRGHPQAPRSPVQAGRTSNTVLVIEHSPDVIKTAGWLIDMGPEGDTGGGTLIATGSPEAVAANEQSYTGQFLAPLLGR
jgi:hypothetical protein